MKNHGFPRVMISHKKSMISQEISGACSRAASRNSGLGGQIFAEKGRIRAELWPFERAVFQLSAHDHPPLASLHGGAGPGGPRGWQIPPGEIVLISIRFDSDTISMCFDSMYFDFVSYPDRFDAIPIRF